MTEKRLLQAAVAIACLVPVTAGGFGVIRGPAMLDIAAAAAPAAAHFRYLSGLLLGIGLGFLSMLPRIEAHGRRFRLLAAIVLVGGLSRLISVALSGSIDAATLFALVMELGVTPALALWQWRVARLSAMPDRTAGRP
jgi:uncharacterized protein DUF4345